MLSKMTLARHVAFLLGCQYLTSSARLPTGIAFVHVNPSAGEAALVQLCRTYRPTATKASFPSHPGYLSQSRYSVRGSMMEPLCASVENGEAKTAQLSDMDARVLNELLGDPTFMESLRERRLEEAESISYTTENTEGRVGGERRGSGETDVVTESMKAGKRSLAVAEKGGGRKSEYESATMQVVEELQDSVKGLIAKLTAAIESAGIYVSNRAQTDAKAVGALVDFASKQAAAGTGKLLLAATGAASPALMLMGINATDTQESLNVSLQLLSLGMAPDSLDNSPKMLTSLKDFDDDDKRLSAAYRRQRRLRGKPLPAKLLGSLPSTLNKAADLAYEVEQEVKYERAGSRANKLLKPLGLFLPEARDTSFLLGGPDPPRQNLLEGTVAEDSSTDLETVPNFRSRQGGVEPDDVKERTASLRARSFDKRKERREPMPPPPDAFGVWKRLWRTARDPEDDQGDLSLLKIAASVDDAQLDPELLSRVVARPSLLANELSVCLRYGEQDVALQERRTEAANAILNSTEPVISFVEESRAQEDVLLEQVRSVAKTVQQQYVLTEMNEAVEAAEARIVRREHLAMNVMELSSAVRTYLRTASERTAQMININSRLEKAKMVAHTAVVTGVGSPDEFTGALTLLKEFDAFRAHSTLEAGLVDDWLSCVCQESPERPLNEAARVQEDALMAAVRLWEVSTLPEAEERVGGFARISKEMASVAEGGVLRSYDTRISSNTNRIEVPKAENSDIDVSGGINDERTLIGDTDPRTVGMVGGGMPPKSLVSDMLQQEGSAIENTSREEVEGMKDDRPPERSSDRVGMDATPIDSEVPSANPAEPVEIQSEEESTAQVGEVLDATVVSEAVARTLYERTTSRQQKEEHADVLNGSPAQDVPANIPSGQASIAVVVDEGESFVDAEAEVEDDVSEASKVGLKILDVTALLVEKVLFVGLPTVVSGGALIWERLDNAANGAKGREGWTLLKRLKNDWSRDEKMVPE